MSNLLDISELHWLLDIVQSIDVGVVVLDRDYRIQVWNSFMENHSGQSARQVSQRSLLDLFPEIDRTWFTQKIETAAMLGTRVFTIWEQRPYLVRFRSYQPITGLVDHMYQNVTILPLRTVNGSTDHVCLIIYDVTNVAINKLQLEAANTQLQELALHDDLTGLLNRRHWENCLEHEFARHNRYSSEASLVIFDIDHFKQLNDTYGHQAGDEVIRQVAEVTQGMIRDTDYAGRYGGEEFVVLLSDTPLEGAVLFAERLCQAVAQRRILHGEQQLQCSVSIGVACIHPGMADHRMLIEEADKALYQAKSGGRNRVVAAGQTSIG
ncbi:sensor domain-containing diguanylate cyclase [Halopseudomonas pertucinogena]|uniref:diguanylate cyclase n=1 Tax=Halopseudomonas pertucinogena TaxID=86175 RepID=A0ABQ2CM32_9GAMM|nr:diguanylate cyclase [Halopseudomonas pertucinogena]GGI94665.1 diguanylate cyclase [Halopseudomonas pertucinogena]